MNRAARIARALATLEGPRRDRERLDELNRRAFDILPPVLRDRASLPCGVSE